MAFGWLDHRFQRSCHSGAPKRSGGEPALRDARYARSSGRGPRAEERTKCASRSTGSRPPSSASPRNDAYKSKTRECRDGAEFVVQADAHDIAVVTRADRGAISEKERAGPREPGKNNGTGPADRSR